MMLYACRLPHERLATEDGSEEMNRPSQGTSRDRESLLDEQKAAEANSLAGCEAAVRLPRCLAAWGP